jgi:hypothetical protein
MAAIEHGHRTGRADEHVAHNPVTVVRPVPGGPGRSPTMMGS